MVEKLAAKRLSSDEVIKDLAAFIQDLSGFIFLAGQNGRGKSYIARQIYHYFYRYKSSQDLDRAWFINQADLNIMFSEQNDTWGSSIYLLKQACKSKVLVLDDLGTRTPSDAFMDFLYAVLDRRWNERDCLITVITTNLDSVGVRQKFGEAIYSRILSGRNYVVIGDDRRFADIAF